MEKKEQKKIRKITLETHETSHHRIVCHMEDGSTEYAGRFLPTEQIKQVIGKLPIDERDKKILFKKLDGG